MSQLGRLDCRIPPSILLRKRLEKENHLPFDRCVITDHSGASGRIVEHHSLPNYQVVFEPFLKEKGSVRYYHKQGWDKLVRVDYHGSKEVPTGTCKAILKAAGIKKRN